MKNVQPSDRKCPHEAHAKVHAAASDGGWQFCPICEVVAMTALALNVKQQMTALVFRYEKLAKYLLERSDLSRVHAANVLKWMHDVREILQVPINPGRPAGPLVRRTVGSPSGRGRSRSKRRRWEDD
jgi:hypothetical protein